MNEILDKPPHFGRRQWVFAGTILVACAIAAYFGHRFWIRPNTLNGGLEISPSSLNIGTVWDQGTTILHKAVVRNTSSEPVKIVAFQASCSCTQLEPATAQLAPNEELTLILHIDVGRTGRQRRNDFESDFSVTVVPVLNDRPASLSGWSFHGRAQRAFNAEPPNLDLGELRSAVLSEPRYVRLSSPVAWKSLVAKGGPLIDASIEPVDSTMTEFKLTIKPHNLSGQPVGAFKSSVDLTGETLADAPPLEAKYSVVGQVLGAARLNPDELLLGVRAVGDTCEQLVCIQASGDLPFKLESLEPINPDVTLRRLPGESSSEVQVAIVVHCQKLGSQLSELSFTISSAEGRQRLTLPVRYHGVPK